MSPSWVNADGAETKLRSDSPHLTQKEFLMMLGFLEKCLDPQRLTTLISKENLVMLK